jgi:hypothetical protein
MKALFRTFVLTIIILSACRKPDTYFEGNASLRFSVDTLVFDTVFTTIGSITKRIKVYNDLSDDVLIDEIRLAKSGNTPYRLNIDGAQTDIATQVLLRSKDSLHIFVEATIDPNDSNEALIRTDSIVFSTNERSQDVDLVAWGQDANFYYNSPNDYVVFENDAGGYDTLFYYSISTPTVWTNEKPHVIYDLVVVENGASLEIMEGAQVYLHHNANLIIGEVWNNAEDVANKSSLKIVGNSLNPVQIASDRLDEYYRDLPGQWGRIWLTANSAQNQIENAIIKNGTIGLQVDTLANSFEPALRIENTIIANNSSYGLLAYASNVEAFNCQISDNGVHDLYLFGGGSYRFSQCTFANYSSGHQAPSIRMSNYYEDLNGNEVLRPMQRADFENCIVYGRVQSELGIEQTEEALFNYSFNNCLLKLKENDFDLSNSAHFSANIYNESPNFVQTMDAYEYNYNLDTLSPAQNSAAGNIALQFPYDLLGNSRLSDTGPDIGAYERLE